MILTRGRVAALFIATLFSGLVGFLAKDSLAPQFRHIGPAGPSAVSRTLNVQNRDGSTRNLASATGKIVAVHFWATWCAPCVEEFPGLVAFAKSAASDPEIEILAVSVDESWETVDKWLLEQKLSGVEMALDSKRETAKLFGTEKFPETWFVGPDGKVLDRQIGPMDWTSEETKKRIEIFKQASGKKKPV